MNDEKLVRTLQSVGQACFVKFFDEFNSKILTRAEIIEKLKAETGYSEKSCISRTGHAKSIINAGMAKKALGIVISSNSKKVSDETRNLALQSIKQLDT